MSDLFETKLFEADQYVREWGLADRFGVPPFSVLDAKSARWQERRSLWDSLHMEDELGRPEGLILGTEASTDARQKILASGRSGTSLFDPVLTELALRWWSPQGGVVLDPFAGGPIRGIVGVDARQKVLRGGPFLLDR